MTAVPAFVRLDLRGARPSQNAFLFPTVALLTTIAANV